MLIDTRAAFEAWLRANGFLEDVEIVAVEIDRSSSTVVLRGTQCVSGGYAAGEVRVLRDLELTAQRASEVSLQGEFVAGHCLEGMTLRESSAGLSFAIALPGLLGVTCERIEITQSAERADIVEQRLDCLRFAVTVHGHSLPTPQEIIEWCSSARLDVVWRYYAGEAMEPRRVPTSDYTGWFVQLRERVEHSAYGVSFYVDAREAGFYLVVETNESELKPICLVLAERLAAMNPSLIHSGNATPGASDWIEYMRQNCC